jgi:hypothetical protein
MQCHQNIPQKHRHRYASFAFTRMDGCVMITKTVLWERVMPKSLYATEYFYFSFAFYFFGGANTSLTANRTPLIRAA